MSCTVLTHVCQPNSPRLWCYFIPSFTKHHQRALFYKLLSSLCFFLLLLTRCSDSVYNIYYSGMSFCRAAISNPPPPPFPLLVCLSSTVLYLCQLACLFDNLLVLFQSVLEALAAHEVQLNRLKEKAQLLWDQHAAGKSFVHRVSQLSAQYLALTNLTKVQ